MIDKEFRVVVLGGYGNFGSVIVQRLCTIAGIRVWVAGRDLAKAERLATQVGCQAVRLDGNQMDLAERLRELQVDLLISTAGPFQGQDYRVARAAIAAGAHYLDLADARAFACGITELDQAARQAGVLVCSGASSVPALSAAVIDQLLPQFGRLDSIWHGISSSEKTPGVSTLAAVLNYCGKPLRQWRDGAWRAVYGWQDLATHGFPAPLGRRWLGNCDIPDLELFPARYPGVRSVRFSAGVGLRLTQFGTWLLSWLVRGGLLRSGVPLAAWLHRGAVWLEPLGDGLSGMFVRLQGQDLQGQPLSLCWDIVAADNHGPNIPCMAAVALARKLAAKQLEQRGAMPCLGLLSVEEYLAELEGLRVSVGVRPCSI
ncbi:saccharopine dehydrogenase family protein [Pseudomonas sp.]|uniref:saccharopine dehydrogenase family protein n=1 Tax=Pseudomonas sp. TaxID=306 RepID=UPI002732DA07|nr:saccharopine dehydrogenase NADP-binding domain-containing protein [Pseudomonas sp.]MDP3814258.1 saccharopine dehydrogenase NADP-binding domain-containing protein [Pseudomonas sp.]